MGKILNNIFVLLIYLRFNKEIEDECIGENTIQVYALPSHAPKKTEYIQF